MSKSQPGNASIRKDSVMVAFVAEVILVPLWLMSWFYWQWDGHYHPEKKGSLLLWFILATIAVLLPWVAVAVVFEKHPARNQTHRTNNWPKP